MYPVLFELPAMPGWVAALAVALLGAVFFWLGRRDKEDRSSWWLAAACGVGAVVVLAKYPGGSLPALPIRLFGILVVAGFLLATKVASWRNRGRNLLAGEETFDLAFLVLLAGIAGARLFHVAQHSDDPEFAGHPQKIFYNWDGGLVWYGGALAGALFAWYWLAKRGKDLWAVSDSLALALPLGHAVGRIGCFCAGCDYGTVVPGGRDSIPWAVHFPTVDRYTLVPMEFRFDADTDADVYIHPVQLYLVLANLLTFAILLWIDRKATKGAFAGRLLAMYLVLYAVARFVLEYWRGDRDRGVWFGDSVSTSQLISIPVFLAGILLYRALRGRHRAAPAAA